jgi:hypothetical protein
LAALDARSFALSAACKALIARRSGLEAVGTTDRRARARVEAVARALARRHAAELAQTDWHGATSIQRLVWQDEQTLELLADAAAAHAVVQSFLGGSERPLGATTLGGALIGGLAVNRPSYLFSASPNWAALPAVARLPTDWLDDMRPPGGARPRGPYLVREATLARAGRALDSLAEVLGWGAGGEGASGRIWQAIGDTSDRSLLAALAALVTPALRATLVRNPAVPSTAVARMRGQCLEVMRLVPFLLDAMDGDLERVLGFGLVSHALDARHLLAMTGPADPDGPDVERAGERAYAALLDDFAAGVSAGAARYLLAARLRQALQLVADATVRSGESLDRLERHLVAVPGAVARPTAVAEPGQESPGARQDCTQHGRDRSPSHR